MAADSGVTYLVANYNNASYVERCIGSLRAQTDGRWRAIVLDDASTDDSVERILAMPDPRIRLIRNEANAGYIAALRRLIREAVTDIVAIVDSDDALEPGATAALHRAYGSDKDVGFVYSRFAVCGEDIDRIETVHGSRTGPDHTCLWHGTVGHILSFRRSIYHATAGLDDTMTFAEDRDLVYKLEEVCEPVFLDEVLYRYRDVAGSQSRDPSKRETGATNTRRARRAALERRRVAGFPRAVWEVLFLADYIAFSHRFPRVIRWLATVFAKRLGRLAHRPSLRSAGLAGLERRTPVRAPG